MENNHKKETNKMTTEELIIERIELLERAMSMLSHPCLERKVDQMEVIIRIHSNKLEAIRLADMKKQTSSTTPLDVIANHIEFGHSHE
jgi:hypothetical protein